METTTELTMKDVLDNLDKRYSLIYVDYQESLDNNLEAVQNAIQAQDKFLIEESIDLFEWYMESRDYAVDEAINELKDRLHSDFDEDEDGEIDAFVEDNIDAIREAIEERDDSYPLQDLIRNTSDTPVFFDLGIDVDGDCWADADSLKSNLKTVKRALKIKLSDRTFDSDLSMMLQQASYGGRLVVYFTGDISELLDLNGANVITFENPMIAVIDTYNGSGDSIDLDGHKFSAAFDPANLFIDKTIKYNYTFAVCGMSSNWADCTRVFFSKKTRKTKPNRSSLHAELDRESVLNATFKAGGCTPRDMDIKRHKDANLYYDNNFPCGTHCKACGTFWID